MFSYFLHKLHLYALYKNEYSKMSENLWEVENKMPELIPDPWCLQVEVHWDFPIILGRDWIVFIEKNIPEMWKQNSFSDKARDSHLLPKCSLPQSL